MVCSIELADARYSVEEALIGREYSTSRAPKAFPKKEVVKAREQILLVPSPATRTLRLVEFDE
jgi:hypothetical protein